MGYLVHLEGSGLHSTGSVQVMFKWQCSLRMWAVIPHIFLFYDLGDISL